MRKRGTPKRTFSAAKLYDAGGDSSKRWFIYYSFLNPETRRFQRFKIYGGLNFIKDKKERRKVARQMIDEMNDLLRKGFDPFDVEKVSETPFLKAVEDYLALKSSTWRLASKNSNSSILKLFYHWLKDIGLGSAKVSDISTETIARYMDNLLNKGMAEKTFNNHRGGLKSFFDYAVERGLCQSNPADPIKLKVVPKGRSGRIITKPELMKVKVVLQEREPFFWLFVQLLYYCFIRPKELKHLQIRDFDLHNSTVSIPSSVAKNGKSETIALPWFLTEQLQYLNDYPSDFFVFGLGFEPSEQKQGKNNANRLWKKTVKEELRIPADLYSCKHRGAIDALNDGMDIRSLQLQLRHSSLEETEVYLSSLTGHNVKSFKGRSQDI